PQPLPAPPSRQRSSTAAVHKWCSGVENSGRERWKTAGCAWIEIVTNGQALTPVCVAQTCAERESAPVRAGGVCCCAVLIYSCQRDPCAARPAALSCVARAGGRAVLGPAAQVLRRGRLSAGALSGKVRFPVSRLRGHWPQPSEPQGQGHPSRRPRGEGKRETAVRPRPRTRPQTERRVSRQWWEP